MFLVAWWLTGVFLGWFVWKFYRAWRSERRRLALDAYSATRLDAITRAVLRSLNDFLARYGHRLGLPLDEDRSKDLIRPSVDALRRRLAGWVVIALLAIALAAATDNAQLYQWMLVVKSYLVGVREQALIVGLLSGIVLRRYRRPLGDFGRRLGNAVIGDKDNTAWALQSALAIGLIAVVIFAARPDFLTYLRSFKLGTVEATFADQGPLPLRDARLNLRDFRAKLFVDQFADQLGSFEQSQLFSPSSDRSRARRLLGEKAELWAREADGITRVFFDQYVRLVLSSVVCLERIRALRTAAHDPDLSGYVSAWENFLLLVHRDQSPMTEENLTSFLKSLHDRSAPFVQRVSALNPDCMDTHTFAEIAPESFPSRSRYLTDREAGGRILSHYKKAIEVLKEHREQSAAKLSLVVFEPYVTAAVADLISLISGEREKADFLLNMLDGFPPSDDLGTPGIINLYYQVTDSQLNSIGSLPLDLMIEQIEYAIRSAKILMDGSEKALNSPETASAGSSRREGEFDQKTLSTIYDIFLRNLFVTQRAEVDIYVQSVLDGETVSQKHRQNWMKATSHLLAVLQQRFGLPNLGIDGLPRTELGSFEAKQIRTAAIDPEFVLQADVSIALSAILLNDAPRTSARNCNTALFYVNEASRWVQPTVETYNSDWALENRLRQLIGAVANRVGDSCNWSDARGQAKPDEPKPK